jgi:hypothetical protein
MSSIGGQRQTLLQAVKHVYSLGGMRAYYRGLAVSFRIDSQRSLGLIVWDVDRVTWRVPVLRNRHEHLRGVEVGLLTVDEAGGTWCPGPARFRKRFWECWCDERVPIEPGSDEAAGFWISGPPTTLYGHVGRGITDVQAERRSWILYRPRADTGKGDPGGFDILSGLRTK